MQDMPSPTWIASSGQAVNVGSHVVLSNGDHGEIIGRSAAHGFPEVSVNGTISEVAPFKIERRVD